MIRLIQLLLILFVTSASASLPKKAYYLPPRITAAAQAYGDFTFAKSGLSLTNSGVNSFTTVAQNASGLKVTNTINPNLPSTLSYTYDNDGNLTSDGTRTFVYDGENQLTNVYVTGQWREDFAYDGLRRKRVTREYSWNGSNWVKTNETRLLYDGMLVVQERDTNNNVLVTYTRGLDLSGSIHGAGGIGGLLARTDANGSVYYHADGSGNVTALMDGSQNIVGRAEYDAYGRFLNRQGAMANVNRYWFSSKEYNSASGLYSFGYRFYEPNLQRWLNRDPIGEAGGANLYEFVRNAPVNWADPWGHTWYQPWTWGNPDPASGITILPNGNWYAGPLPIPSKAPPREPDAFEQTGLPSNLDGAQPGSIIQNQYGVEPGDIVKEVGWAVPKGIVEAAMMVPLGAEEGAYAAADEALQAARAAKVANKCTRFSSFRALKKAFPNNPGKVWHHIVEQSQEGRFGSEAIHSLENVVEVSPEINSSLNALYSSINPEITGSTTQTIRQWLSTQSFEQAKAFGLQAVQNVLSGKWP